MGFESVRKIAEADFPTRWGAFRIMGFEGVLPAARPCCEHGEASGKRVEGLVALVMGDIHSAPRWFASTRSASPAMYSDRCVAIAACNSSWR